MRASFGVGAAVVLLSLAAVAACSKNGGGGGDGGGQTSTGGASTGGASTGGASSTTDSGSPTGSTTTTSSTEPALPSDARVIFLHHSTGGVIWGGGVSEALAAYDAAHGKTYAIEEQAYPDAPYPWQNYPYDYWHLWVESGGAAAAEGVPTLAELAQDHDVIVWKHCFPVSGIEADTGAPDLTSETKSLENYELQYAALKTLMRAMPDKRFLVWTGAALREADSTPEQGARARQFFTWVKQTWDEPGDNIFVWDFFELETEGGNFLQPAYATGDSHPSDAFAETVAPYFVNRLVDVIEGRGDTGSLTGK
jgi:hypothetical protein